MEEEMEKAGGKTVEDQKVQVAVQESQAGLLLTHALRHQFST